MSKPPKPAMEYSIIIWSANLISTCWYNLLKRGGKFNMKLTELQTEWRNTSTITVAVKVT